MRHICQLTIVYNIRSTQRIICFGLYTMWVCSMVNVYVTWFFFARIKLSTAQCQGSKRTSKCNKYLWYLKPSTEHLCRHPRQIKEPLVILGHLNLKPSLPLTLMSKLSYSELISSQSSLTYLKQGHYFMMRYCSTRSPPPFQIKWRTVLRSILGSSTYKIKVYTLSTHLNTVDVFSFG